MKRAVERKWKREREGRGGEEGRRRGESVGITKSRHLERFQFYSTKQHVFHAGTAQVQFCCI